MLSELPKRVMAFELPLLESVSSDEVPTRFKVRQRTNLVLNLSPTLEGIRAGYGKTLRKKLRRYTGSKLINATPDEVIRIYKASSGQKAGLSADHYEQINQLMQASAKHETGECLSLIDDSGTGLAAGFFPTFGGRIINLFGGSTEKGFRNDGMARLIDAVIARHHGSATVFDFEGSDIPGVASFFKSFGAETQTYLSIKK